MVDRILNFYQADLLSAAMLESLRVLDRQRPGWSVVGSDRAAEPALSRPSSGRVVIDCD